MTYGVIKRMKWWESLLITLIILVGFSVRLYRFSGPIADWQSWRQADTSAVSRGFVERGFDVLHPTFEDISNVPSGKDNPNGYRFVEFPIYNIAQAGLYKIFGGLTLEEWGRMITIIASLAASFFVYLLGKKHFNSAVGLLAAGFLALDPYNIYYGRVILPDPLMVTTTLGGIYFFNLWVDDTGRYWWSFFVAFLFISSSLLLKPYALFFFLPLVYLAFKKWSWKMFIKPQLWLFAIGTILPLVGWRIWMTGFPEGIPANSWLFNGNGIRFKGAYFYWLFADRIGRLILGYWGLFVVLVGFTAKFKRGTGFFVSFLLSSLLYLIVIATGNVQHDYYQILITPTLAFFFGLGGYFLLTSEVLDRKVSSILFVISTVFMIMFGWYFIRDYFNINNPAIVIAGEAVDRLTPKDAKVIAPYNGDTAFLYQTKRKGWPVLEKPLPDLISMGADYLVIANPQQQDLNLGKTYGVISKTNQYLILNLHETKR